ncbi:MAG: tRNA preQ1(34) S-adenosylmethionine ribosyltransferase-isomerase QueA [Lentisphaerae bacterium GWF2_52_8]|nr:MAG: tRNA preQ1(34) S-adenosylmethionine ribosyltransferase-isomerase QueA [Lentisphaerae bacterium GWF2_52_8]
MLTSDFDYQLPEELIAQHPPSQRGESKMLAMERNSGICSLYRFSELPDFLTPRDCIILNDTRVMRARLFGVKEGAGGAMVEILLLSQIPGEPDTWHCLLKPAKRVRIGTKVFLLPREGGLPGNEYFTLTDKDDDGKCRIKFSAHDIARLQREYGHIPLPPYIKRSDEAADSERYQTVFAERDGAVAAPTAGLHFTEAMLGRLAQMGISLGRLTLHVGSGTFKPVSVEMLEDHKMHSEYYELSPETAELINRTRQNGGRVLAIGTTVVRVLETCASHDASVLPGAGSTDIFIHPPCKPQVADMLLTNFHLPKSTLLMLVSTFSSREKLLAAYRTAISERLRFYSYGDCMLLF